jgi:hypothetical protein
VGDRLLISADAHVQRSALCLGGHFPPPLIPVVDVFAYRKLKTDLFPRNRVTSLEGFSV